MTKYFYLWIGQNATTGTPNPITGHYSNYGRIVKFATKALRDEYVDQWRSNNPSEFTHKVNRKTARKYCLGDSMRDYFDYLDHYCLEFVKIDNRWENI